MNEYFRKPNFEYSLEIDNILDDIPVDATPFPVMKGTSFWRSFIFPIDKNGKINKNHRFTNKTRVLLCQKDYKNGKLEYKIGKLISVSDEFIELYVLNKKKAQIYTDTSKLTEWENLPKKYKERINFKFILFIVILIKWTDKLLEDIFKKQLTVIKKGTKLFHGSVNQINMENRPMFFSFSRGEAWVGKYIYSYKLKKDIVVIDALPNPRIHKHIIRALLLNSRFSNYGSFSKIINKLFKIKSNDDDPESYALFDILKESDTIKGVLSISHHYKLSEFETHQKSTNKFPSLDSDFTQEIQIIYPLNLLEFIKEEVITQDPEKGGDLYRYGEY